MLAGEHNGGGRHTGGVCLVVQYRPQGCSIEAMRFHGTNVVSCKVVTDEKRIPIIGAYLPPSTPKHLPELEEALTLFQYQDPIVIGTSDPTSTNPITCAAISLLIY